MLQTILPMGTEGEHSVLLPHLSEVVWSLIILVILFAVILKVMYPRYIQITNERAEKIQLGIEQAENAKAQVARAQAEAQALLRQANEESAQLRREAQETAQKIIAEAKTQAGNEAERIVTNAQRQIEVERQTAEISLRTEVGLLAADLAENIVGEQLKDRELSARVVDRFLDQLEAETKLESVKS